MVSKLLQAASANKGASNRAKVSGEAIINDALTSALKAAPAADKNKFLADAINRYSSGGHPVATADNLGGFQKPFVRECLDKALKDAKLTADGRKLVQELLIDYPTPKRDLAAVRSAKRTRRLSTQGAPPPGSVHAPQANIAKLPETATSLPRTTVPAGEGYKSCQVPATKAAARAELDNLEMPDHLKRPRTPESDAKITAMVERDRNRTITVRPAITNPKSDGVKIDRNNEESVNRQARKAQPATSTKKGRTAAPLRADGLRTGSKAAIMIDLVSRAKGATKSEIQKATGWDRFIWTLKEACKTCKLELIEDKSVTDWRYTVKSKGKK